MVHPLVRDIFIPSGHRSRQGFVVPLPIFAQPERLGLFGGCLPATARHRGTPPGAD